MKIFISWSGEKSKILAESLKTWLPNVINVIEPFVSSVDIDLGTRWSPVINSELEGTKFGILCINKENYAMPWVNFEAGAIGRFLEGSRVIPYLMDLQPTDITGPLSQFQAGMVTKTDTKRMIVAINQAVKHENEKWLEDKMLDEAFEVWWPKLDNAISTIPIETSPSSNIRSDRQLLEEILTLVRGLKNTPKFRITRLPSQEELELSGFSSSHVPGYKEDNMPTLLLRDDNEIEQILELLEKKGFGKNEGPMIKLDSE